MVDSLEDIDLSDCEESWFFDLINQGFIRSLEMPEEYRHLIKKFEEKTSLEYFGMGITQERECDEPMYYFSDGFGYLIDAIEKEIRES